MLKEIGSVDRIPEYIKRAKDGGDSFQLTGFGYRVYKANDPKSEDHAEGLARGAGNCWASSSRRSAI